MKQTLVESHTGSQFKIIKNKPANVLKRIQMKEFMQSQKH